MNRGTARLWSLLVAISVATSTTAQTTFTWTGNTATVYGGSYATTMLLDPGNWAGNVPPASDATATGSNLVFGLSHNVSSGGWVNLQIGQDFNVRSLTFNSPHPYYLFDYVVYGQFGIGLGGVTVGDAGRFVRFPYSMGISLLASQTWHTGGGLQVYGPIGAIDSQFTLTKTGAGELRLDNTSSNFGGGLDVQAGTLVITGSSEVDGALLEGPVGSGPLTLRSGTTLWGDTDNEITLHNPLRLGSGVSIGHLYEETTFRFKGTVTPLQAATVIQVAGTERLFFDGAIGNAVAGATTLTFATLAGQTERGVALLGGTNTYTGGTVADRAAVIFTHPGALPASGPLSAVNAGYLGTTYDGGMTAILTRIASPIAFHGALGFDTDLDVQPIPTTFADPLNLSTFSPDHQVFLGLGTLTAARLTGPITPPLDGEYVFGGGDGYLVVQSNLLAAGSAGVRVQSTPGAPLTVVLQGANTFTGSLKSDHSVVILDSPTALPAGAGYQLDDGAYVGYTENFTAVANPAGFLARLNGANYSSTSVLGFDASAAHRASGRTIVDPVNLAGFAADVYLGSATKAYLEGTLTAPATGTLSLTGVKGGWLIVGSSLPAGPVVELRVGLPDDDSAAPGLVLLGSGASTFVGNTAFLSGVLGLGASSVDDGGVVSGPVGRGSLVVSGYSPHYLAAAAGTVVLHNPISFEPGASLMVGVPSTGDPDHPAYAFQDWIDHDLSLAGSISGHAATLQLTGEGTVTLGGDNDALIHATFELSGRPLVVAAHDHALGGAFATVSVADGADLRFTTLHPSVGVLTGGINDDGIYNYVVLPDNATLTINQFADSTLTVNLGGLPAEGYSSSDGSNPSSAALVKTGSGRLTLEGASFLTGGLTVNAGTVYFGSLEATHVGPITLNGGTLGSSMGVGLDNPVSFGGGGGRLTGWTVFNHPLTIEEDVVLAPGGSPGMLSFAAGLTLAPLGAFEIEVADATGSPGWGWDLLSVSGALAAAGGKSLDITATPGSRFTLVLTALGPNDTIDGVPVGFDAASPFAWTIAIADNGIHGFSVDKFFIDSSLFSAANGGSFGLSVTNLGGGSEALLLNFTPVPEPPGFALLGAGVLVVALRRRRHLP